MQDALHDFGPVWAASGLMGFFGEGYQFHSVMPWRMYSRHLKRITFVAKTATWQPRMGNMPLRHNYMPVEFLPRCIWSDPLNARMLNVVGLTNPGLEHLCDEGEWQKQRKPFMISVMATAGNLDGKLRELNGIAEILRGERFLRATPLSIGLQHNVSCPNIIGHSDTLSDIIKEAELIHQVCIDLGLPHIIKLNALTPIEAAQELDKYADAMIMGNTIPFGSLPPELRVMISGNQDRSPLNKRGFELPGGLSGPDVFAMNIRWLKEARRHTISCHINVGSIFTRASVRQVLDCGGNSTSLGTVFNQRPWRVGGIIDEAERRFG